jgi:ADP-ribose pyrophosphatase
MGEDTRQVSCSVAYSTEWFELVSKKVRGEAQPHFALRMSDYVSVVALTPAGEMVLVRQYRPAVEQYTLELPGGHVDANESPETSARRELEEETGFTSQQMEDLGTLLSDSGRHENRLRSYLATDVSPPSSAWSPEEGVEVVLVPVNEVHDLILRGEFNHALHLSVLMLATLRRHRCLSSLLSAPAA